MTPLEIMDVAIEEKREELRGVYYDHRDDPECQAFIRLQALKAGLRAFMDANRTTPPLELRKQLLAIAGGEA